MHRHILISSWATTTKEWSRADTSPSHSTSVSSSSTVCCLQCTEFRWCCFRGSKASTTICSVPLISALQNGQPWKWEEEERKDCLSRVVYYYSLSSLLTCPSESTCHAFRQGVHNRWPQGSIRMSLSFSAQILHSWKVLPAIENPIK